MRHNLGRDVITKQGKDAPTPKPAPPEDKDAPPPEKDKAEPAPLPEPAEEAANPALRLTVPQAPVVITSESGKYVRQVGGPDNSLEIIAGRLQILELKQAPKRIQVGDDSVANYALLGPTELSLQGLRVGSTVLNLWFTDASDPKKTQLVSFLVRVLPDPEARIRLERAYKNLEKEINRVFPNSKVYLTLVGDRLAVCGQAHDIADANMIMRMVQANVLPEAADSPDLGKPAGADPASNYNRLLPAFHRQVVNMLRVVGEQQVMLQVQIAEVNRAAARTIGLNFTAFGRNSGFFLAGTTGNLAQTSLGRGVGLTGFTNASSLGLTGFGGLPNLPIALDRGQILLAIAALRDLGYSRYLAEPNLVAINGQTANFQAGGLLPVPVLSGNAGTTLQG